MMNGLIRLFMYTKYTITHECYDDTLSATCDCDGT